MVKRRGEPERERRREQHLGFDSCVTAVHHPAGNNGDVVGLKQQTHSGTRVGSLPLWIPDSFP